MESRNIFTTIALIIIFTIESSGQRPVRFNNEQSDTTRITQMLIELENSGTRDPQKLTAMAAKMMIGVPYKSGTLERTPEMITINMDSVDCTTFVETATAMAMTIMSRRSSWHDFIYNIEQLRYRGGVVDGYPSRLHYVSDWIIDNSHRGTLREVTDRIGKADFAVKTIDYMSTHRSAYPAMTDSTNYTGIKNMEIGFRSHRFPFIKPTNVKSAQIKEGDIIAITTSVKNLDVSHLGIATIVDGEVRLLHASSKAGKVIAESAPLTEYLRKNRMATGIRVVRLTD